MIPAPAAWLLQFVLMSAAAWITLHDDDFAHLCAGRALYPAAALLFAGLAGLARSRLRARSAGTPVAGTDLHWLTLPAAIALFMVPLADAWGSLRSHGAFVGGVLPYSDAGDYLNGALGLLANGTLDAWNSRRPLNAALLALRLGLAHGDLQAALVTQAIVLAASSWLAARAIARDLGWAAGAIILGGMLTFGGIFVATTMSESLGLSLGALALATLWHSARDRERWRLALGFLTLTAALQARSGPMFVLPALVGWATLSLHDRAETGRRWCPRNLAAALLGVAGGAALNALLTRVHHGATGGGQANFSYTLYGIVVGGKGWEQAWADFPVVRAMPEPEGAAFIYKHALAHLQAHPGDLALGLFRNVECLVFSWTEQASGDALAHHPAAQWAVGVAVAIAATVAIRALLRAHPNDASLTLVAAAGAGIVASVPVIYIDGRERVFAAAFPFAVAGVAYALASVSRAVAAAPADASEHASLGAMPATLSALLLLGALLGVPAVRAVLPETPVAHTVRCARGHGVTLWTRYIPAAITLVDDPSALAVPHESVVAFRRAIYRDPNLGTNDLGAALTALPAGTELTLAFDLISRRLDYYASSPLMLRRDGATLDACVTPATTDARTVQFVAERVR